MKKNRQLATSTTFDEQLSLLKEAEIASGVAAPDTKPIWACFIGMIMLAVLCMTFAVSGNREAANLTLLSLWPMFGLLTFFQRSARFKRKVSS